MDATTIRTTCPRDCYDACGMLVKLSADGRINVVGDPEHSVSRGALCGKCSIGYNGVWRDASVRLTRPLKRVGPKGTGRFEPTSWNKAIGDIANRLNTIRGRDGAGTILQTHYTGTCSLIAGSFPLRFFNSIGATEVEAPRIMPGAVITPNTLASAAVAKLNANSTTTTPTPFFRLPSTIF